jgi:hypothetical protein
MKQFLLPAITLFIFLISCKKIDRIDIKGICRIEMQRTYVAEGVMPRYYSYNKYENPIEVRFEEEGTGRETFIFTYDKKNRLIHYRGYTEHFYTYDKYGNAVIDTIHSNYAGQDHWLAEKLFYDMQGRVIKTETKFYKSPSPEDFGLGETVTEVFYYDNNGNLIRPNYTYDNKVSMLRTNIIWMLIHKDYSLNNPIYNFGAPPAEYNNFGLPVRGGSLGFLSHGVEETVYNCKGNPK